MEFKKRHKDLRIYIEFPAWRICACFTLLFLFSTNIFAGPAGKQQAEKVVRGWLKKDTKPLGALPGRQIKNTDIFYNEDSEPMYYVIYLQPSGFVIVPAEDRVEPIICIAAGQTYNPSDDSPLGALVSGDIPNRIAAVRALDADINGLQTEASITNRAALLNAGTRASDKWSQLSSQDDTADSSIGILGTSSISDVRVAPLVQSTWGQTTVGGYTGGITCYNYYIQNNWPCGCVATAMVQLMRYHEYPGTYVWSNMPLQPDSGITLTQRQAIGALCYNAAESIDTIYGPPESGGSSASLTDASAELEDTFYYDNSIYGHNPSIGTALNNMINPNLDAEHPVLLSIDGPDGGHSVMCDGYGYNGYTLYHHINMGWDGREDAWYNLPDVDSLPYYFTSINGCAYNNFTSNTGEIISGRATDIADNPIPGVTVTASGGGTYYATTNEAGIYALRGVPWNQSFKVSASKPPHTFANQYVSTGKSNDWSSTSGNKWGVNFTSQSAGPPVAYGQSVTVLSGRTESITLIASDDGLPNPPGQLSYIISALPQHGTLTDPGGGEITNVPYTLAGNGNIVEYWPCSYFVGEDWFDFKANDGGTPPQGGDSEPAAVTIDVNNTIYTTFEPQTNLYAPWPMQTNYHDGRTQVIYLSSEIGGAKAITDLALDVYQVPGQPLNNWTIRMKHTSKNYYPDFPFFETSGWTTVYQGNDTISSTGWRNFHFQNAFEYNGTSNLMIDFTHNNSYYSYDGYCMASDMGLDRVVMSFANSTHGDPMSWTDYSSPGIYTSSGVPNIKLISSVASDEPLVGDFEPDCKVGIRDLGILSTAWLSSFGDDNWNPDCDIHGPSDNIINFLDFCVLAEHWLESIP